MTGGYERKPELLLSVDRGVTWPENRGILRRVAGPMRSVSSGESLTWFDPLDGRPGRRGGAVSGE